MKLALKKPLTISGGELSLVEFPAMTLSDAMKIEKLGGIENKHAQAHYFCSAKHYDASNSLINVNKDDYLNCKTLALRNITDTGYKSNLMYDVINLDLVRSSNDKKLKETYQDFPIDLKFAAALKDGELYSNDPLSIAPVIKLSKPIVIETNGVRDEYSFITIGERSYGNLEGVITQSSYRYFEGIHSFIVNYCEIYDVNERTVKDIFNHDKTIVDRMTVEDALRIRELIIDPFDAAEADSFKIVD